MSVELALANAIASVEMEGFHLTDEGYDLCYKYANGEITFDVFLQQALELINEA